MKKSIVGLFAAMLLLVSSLARAEDGWIPPANGNYSEKQLTSYLDALNEWLDATKATVKAAEGSKSGLGALAIAARADERFKAILAKHDLKQEEFSWLGERVFGAYSAMMMQEMVEKGRQDLATQVKNNEQQIDALKRKVMAYEAAMKSNVRMLTPEQREDMINSAKSDAQSAADEAKSRADEVKAASDEAAQREKEAADADAAAENPPKDLSDEDRGAFVQQKKEEAETARAAAKEARDRAAESRRVQDDCDVRAKTARDRAAHPDVPTTDEEKAQVKQDNEQALAAVKSELAVTEQAAQLLKESGGQLDSIQKDTVKEPAANIDLLRKHRAAFEKIWGAANAK